MSKSAPQLLHTYESARTRRRKGGIHDDENAVRDKDHEGAYHRRARHGPGSSAHFYVDTLGFAKRIDVTLGTGLRWIEVAPHESNGASLALIRATQEVPAGVETGVRLLTQDADATHAAMKSDDVGVDDVLRWPDAPPMFAFRDQDGNGLEIVQDE